ncbi:hypothetical protein [Paracidovorax anthurii]|uniref:Uncharacterized protein n=1 Tax=Paracidovorax anthurii TaxID=78229 RepID=A0A328YJB7_9BURK|nr:hypothetical protein [Paracidovorax anthurii]RAR74069.1 hypothetical protein AX018_106617 [Paracidovorax anthurii]
MNLAMQIAMPVLQLALLGCFLVVFYRQRAMKKRQDALVREFKGRRCWRINVARPAYFKRRLRFLPFEGKGILIDEGGALRLKGFWNRDERPFDVTIDPGQSRIEWLGNRSMRAGNLYWAQLTAPRGTVLFSADTGMNALPSREALADIFHALFPEQAPDEVQTADFALEKNPRSRAVVAAFFALLAFGLLDTFVVSHFELTDAQIARILRHPLTWLATLATGAALVAATYRYLLRGDVPARESMALAGLLCAVAVLSALPAAKRLDQLLASGPTQMHDYRIASPAHLEPVNGGIGLPNMRFPRAKEYWAQYPQGSIYPIPFLRGPLGLWQLDHEAFDPPLRDFYEKH